MDRHFGAAGCVTHGRNHLIAKGNRGILVAALALALAAECGIGPCMVCVHVCVCSCPRLGGCGKVGGRRGRAVRGVLCGRSDGDETERVGRDGTNSQRLDLCVYNVS